MPYFGTSHWNRYVRQKVFPIIEKNCFRILPYWDLSFRFILVSALHFFFPLILPVFHIFFYSILVLTLQARQTFYFLYQTPIYYTHIKTIIYIVFMRVAVHTINVFISSNKNIFEHWCIYCIPRKKNRKSNIATRMKEELKVARSLFYHKTLLENCVRIIGNWISKQIWCEK